MKIMKKLVSCILVLAAMLTLSVPAFAAQPATATPQYANASDVTASLSINSSGYATVKLRITGNANFKSATITSYIQKKVGNIWMTVSSTWNDSTTSAIATKSHGMQLSESGEYRVYAVFTLTGSVTENAYRTSTCSY